MNAAPIAQWLADLALLPETDAEHWQPFRHTLAEQRLDIDTLSTHLAALGPVSGWLTETGRVVQLRQQVIDLHNHPLEGEFFANSRHWQLVHHGRGQWRLYEHQLQTCPAAEATHLGEPVSHLLAGTPGARLRYWRLWTAGVDRAPHCSLAVLAAIEEPTACP